MDRLEIIDLVKPAAIETMQNRRILASILIAESVIISDSKREILYNNPLDLRSMKTDKLFIFKSIEECFDCFVDMGIIANGYRGVLGNYDYTSVAKSLRLGDKINTLIEIIKAYQLDEIDKKVLKDMYSGKRTIIEIDSTPFMDLYRVRKSFKDKTEKIATFDLDEAKKVCDEWLGYSVFNSRGKPIYVNALTEEVKAKIDLEEHIPAIVPKTGSRIKLNAVNLYKNPDDTVPFRSITGDYYIYSAKKYNGRYMVVRSAEDLKRGGEYILGYINDSNRV